MKKAVSLLICLALAAGMPPAVAAQPEQALSRAISYYDQKQTLASWWDMAALYGAGVKVADGEYILPALPMSDLTSDPSPASYAGRIFAALALNQNPRTFYAGSNMVSALEGMQSEQGAFSGYVNQHIYAMLALEAAGAAYNREEARAFLLSCQGSDGGFSFYSGTDSDVDMTGMALIALSLFDDDQTAGAVDRAVEFLRVKRGADGGYVSPWSASGSSNSCSAASVLSGLVSAGIDVTRGEWAATYESLLSMQQPDGGFCYEPGSSSDAYSTQQALVALGDIRAGDSVFKRIRCDGTAERILTFDDLGRLSPWAVQYVRDALNYGLVVGDARNFFNPQRALTYAELAVMLERMNGAQPEQTAEPGALWYGAAMVRLQKATGGVTGEVSPQSPVLRGDLAVVLANVLNLPEGDRLPPDVAASDPVSQAVSSVYAAGIMTGGTEGDFRSNDSVTRQEAVKALTLAYLRMKNA